MHVMELTCQIRIRRVSVALWMVRGLRLLARLHFISRLEMLLLAAEVFALIPEVEMRGPRDQAWSAVPNLEAGEYRRMLFEGGAL